MIKDLSWRSIAAVTCLLFVGMLAGCAAPPPRDFSGKWQPVNHYASTVEPIPLTRRYEYHASPLDVSLKGMLARWAKDTGMRLDYRVANDFTLTTSATAIHTTDVGAALSELNAIYSAEGLTVADHSGWFEVTTTASAASAVTAPAVPVTPTNAPQHPTRSAATRSAQPNAPQSTTRKQ